MTMAYIRQWYGVPAKRGGRVRLGLGFGGVQAGWTGTITAADGAYLRVRFDPPNDRRVLRVHPTWEIHYL